MKPTKVQCELVVKVLRQEQPHLQNQIENALAEAANQSDRSKVFEVVVVFTENPSKCDWKILLSNMESLLEHNLDNEIATVVYQDVLETLANTISNGLMEHSYLTQSIGPLCRDYIVEYDQLMNSKTPGF